MRATADVLRPSTNGIQKAVEKIEPPSCIIAETIRQASDVNKAKHTKTKTNHHQDGG